METHTFPPRPLAHQWSSPADAFRPPKSAPLRTGSKIQVAHPVSTICPAVAAPWNAWICDESGGPVIWHYPDHHWPLRDRNGWWPHRRWHSHHQACSWCPESRSRQSLSRAHPECDWRSSYPPPRIHPHPRRQWRHRRNLKVSGSHVINQLSMSWIEQGNGLTFVWQFIDLKAMA